jgi:hypothetical protein
MKQIAIGAALFVAVVFGLCWVAGVWPHDTPDWFLSVFGGERARVM